jgi:transposase-like protein
VWLYFRFPLSLHMVEEMLAARGIIVRHASVRQWARKFGQAFANQIRRRLPRQRISEQRFQQLSSVKAAGWPPSMWSS